MLRDFRRRRGGACLSLRGAIVVVFLLGSCGGVKCGPADRVASGECQLDDCADSCGDADAATACCVDSHGWGLTSAEADLFLRECGGSFCDSSAYLSSGAAVCIAQVHGLSPGIGDCAAILWLTDSGAKWTVWNVVERTCPDSGFGHSEGVVITVDAVTGEYLGLGDTSSLLADCDE